MGDVFQSEPSLVVESQMSISELISLLYSLNLTDVVRDRKVRFKLEVI